MADRVAKTLKNPPIQKTDERHGNNTENPSSPPTPSNFRRPANEDYNRSDKSRATGYIGANSEIAWIQQLNSQASKRNDEETNSAINPQLQFPVDDSIASMNYHLDYKSLSKPDLTTPFDLPPKSLADALYQVYLEKAHPSFPVIRPDLFHDQLDRCYCEKRNPGRKWLALFNVILAIACALSRLSAQKQPHAVDEDVFSARARALGLSGQLLYDHSDLQQVQTETLMAFYFLIQSQINRSWKMIGIAARSSIALGLNIDKRTNILDVKSREARRHLWWSIFRLESILCVMTGRVSCLGNASLSGSPPFLGSELCLKIPDIAQPIDQLQWTVHMDDSKLDSQGRLLGSLVPTRSLYFFYMVDLSLITHDMINDIYATDSSQVGWRWTNGLISKFSQKVAYWASTIHPSFGFQNGQVQQIPTRSSVQFSLALKYYSTLILLHRPCLNGPAFKSRSDSPDSGARLTDKLAFRCIRASLAVIALLPDQPCLDWVYEVPQWWDLLHILTQAIVILLLGISVDPLPADRGNVAPLSDLPVENPVWASVEKGLFWLECMGETSEAARRAFHFIKSIIQRIVPSKVLRHEDTPQTIEKSQTPSDPKFPWLPDSPRRNSTSFRQEINALDNSGSMLPHYSSNSAQEGIRFQVSREKQYPIVPLAATVLDTEMNVLDPASIHGSAIEDILYNMLDFDP
ncbi:hypothetical protein N7492_006748 [Penicillium capsulatum]|uniref:Xylanolytic transcriptional activator regulatory domain-containing protein n=1 Tax=Penicillium capsulatum TaxID=69766 RepID=A0A9W9LLF8_9EURO|nr:hypothetical protein N7492_006748 [Penicillium capsulatum]KAJ6116584.1 hypothetical protein N7512_006309 [Penicillium capsulatum]